MPKIFTLIVLFGVILTQTGCKRSRFQKSIAELPKTASDSSHFKPAEIPVELHINEVDFQYLKLKTKIDFISENLSQSFPATVHIKKDSLIWISVAVGIEAARCLITEDSILMMDRINRKYYGLSIKELSRQFNFDFDFKLLQSLIIGNLPFERKPDDIVQLNSLYTSLMQVAGDLRIENQVDNVSHKLSTILAEDKSGKSKLGISYTNFLQLPDEQEVPQAIFAKIDVLKGDQLKSTTLDFKHTKIEFQDVELRFPYSVPKSYEKGEIVF